MYDVSVKICSFKHIHKYTADKNDKFCIFFIVFMFVLNILQNKKIDIYKGYITRNLIKIIFFDGMYVLRIIGLVLITV